MIKNCKRGNPCEVLMDLKRLRFPQDRDSNGPHLFWCFDFTSDVKTKESAIYNQSISILDDLSSADNIEMLPDPTMHVIGIYFEKAEADNVERSLSPSTYSRSQRGRDDEMSIGTDRERDIPTSRTNQIQTGRETSGDPVSARQVAGASRDKNKSALSSITNRYMKFRGTLPGDSSVDSPTNELPIKPKVTSPSKIVDPGSAGKIVGANSNKFNLNLSAVRRVSAQVKTTAPTSGREKEQVDLAGLSSTLYSDRRRNINTPSSTLNKLSSRGTKYIQEKKSGVKTEDSLRDDSNPSMVGSIKRRGEVSSAMSSRLRK